MATCYNVNSVFVTSRRYDQVVLDRDYNNFRSKGLCGNIIFLCESDELMLIWLIPM